MTAIVFQTTQSNELRVPRVFAIVALGWGVLGLAISLIFFPPRMVSAGWFLGFWALSLFDFYVIAGLSRALLTQPIHPGRAYMFGSLKFVCLGLFGIGLTYAKDAAFTPVMLGLVSLMLIPLVGSMWVKPSGVVEMAKGV